MLATTSSPGGGVTLTLPPGHDLVQIKGSVMTPTFQPGELVLVDRTVRRVVGEGVYFVHDGLGESCQRISPGAAPGLWAVYADNPSYSRREDPLDRIAVTGRIVGVFREV